MFAYHGKTGDDEGKTKHDKKKNKENLITLHAMIMENGSLCEKQ